MLLKHLAMHPADYLVVVFDSGSKNFRHVLYTEYKSNRPPAPEELSMQCAPLREAVEAFNIASEEQINYEADDVIATLAAKYAADDVCVRILSADKDLLQLLDDNIKIYDPIKSRYLTDEYVQEKFGVMPDKLLDAMALTGDSSDNIPGVPSIGVKTAAKLINEFGSLEGVLNSAEQISQKRCREMLLQYSDQARLSRDLISLDRNVVLEGDIEKYAKRSPNVAKLAAMLNKYELTSLEGKVAKYCNTFAEHMPVAEEVVSDLRESSVCDVSELLRRCKYSGKMALYLTEEDGQIREISAAFDCESALTIRGFEEIHEFIEAISPILASDNILKIVYDAKSMLRFLPGMLAYDDIMVMSYVLEASSHNHSFDSMSQRHLGKLGNISQACIVASLHRILRKKLFEARLFTVYYTLERPLIPAIYTTQEAGVKVSISLLQQLSEDFTAYIRGLEEEIYLLAGGRFNIASSKQLGQVLFEKMKIGNTKKMPSGTYCTRAEVLTAYATEGVEIADRILKWRHYTKLKSTYTDALVKQVNKNTWRVHTSYSMVATATGRISSSNPNLQNIPIRSKEGEKIRKAFIASEGHKLVAADYSQMELKIMAHIADVKAFRQAFADGLDIHVVTARQIFGDYYEIDSELRRRAKSINFGIIYGMGAFGLARNIGVSRREASGYVEQYFQHYPEIKDYMESIKEFARKYGYTTTVFGRKCFIDGIRSRQRAVRSIAERAAINAPIQGTAADVVKKAMIRLYNQLEHGTIIMQVHDELVVEVPNEHVPVTAQLMKRVMEEVVQFSVPLTVDVSVGNNWGEMEKVLL